MLRREISPIAKIKVRLLIVTGKDSAPLEEEDVRAPMHVLRWR